ncbi:MAG: large subunit ribosomal protein [Patescibacteria group bacterium]|nr:large subunit ribosomal protein [Patescibacteria group bacterium]
MIDTKKYTVDASGNSLGRIASEVASLLNGKNTIDFVKNKVVPITVEVVNASKMKVTGNKMNEVVHKNFSGYPGGLKQTPLIRVIEKKGYAELLRHSVRGMLPKNKLQDEKMKNLIISE